MRTDNKASRQLCRRNEATAGSDQAIKLESQRSTYWLIKRPSFGSHRKAHRVSVRVRQVLTGETNISGMGTADANCDCVGFDDHDG